MNLWVRSQDRECLLKIDIVMLEEIEENKEYWIYAGHEKYEPYRVFGVYHTKERALEVLDEIQDLLQLKIEYKPIVQEEYNPAYTYKHFVKVDDNMEIKEFSTFVYQMPED